jgi:hypothetical protein
MRMTTTTTQDIAIIKLMRIEKSPCSQLRKPEQPKIASIKSNRNLVMLAENVLVLQVSTFEEAGRETNMHGVVNGLFSCKMVSICTPREKQIPNPI